ncbi:MAG: hypothetical protein ISS47_05085 [Candidatus Omnitrophica bacterium]|nr:hypothetical protein [Candidatus Omnitrophota bacterium]
MPLGIYYLAAYLLRKGEEVKVIDGEALNLEHKDIVQILNKSDVKIVGLTSATVSFHRVCSLDSKR